MTMRFGMSLRGLSGIEESARRIEALGFDYLASGEHVAFHVPTPNNFISLSVAAGATDRIGLVSAITLLPLYPAVLAAKLGAALDVASGGRFVMGVGVGGRKPAAMRRAAAHGTGWMPYMYSPEMLRDSLVALGEECARIGRDPAEITPVQYVFTCVHEDRDVAIDHAVATLGSTYAHDFRAKAGRYTIVGTPAECRDRLAQYVEAGARVVLFASACPADYVAINQQLIADELVAAYR